MKSIIEKIKNCIRVIWNGEQKKISARGWGNSYNDIYILKIILMSQQR
jgi:hypothetical protein